MSVVPRKITPTRSGCRSSSSRGWPLHQAVTGRAIGQQLKLDVGIVERWNTGTPRRRFTCSHDQIVQRRVSHAANIHRRHEIGAHDG